MRKEDLKKTWLKMSALLLASAGFWGFVYPRFSMTPQTYRVVVNGKVLADRDPREDFYGMMAADKGEIRVKSKLLDWIEEKLDEPG